MSEEDIGIKVFYFQKYINSIKYMNEQQKKQYGKAHVNKRLDEDMKYVH